LGVLAASGAVFQTELFRQVAPLPIIGLWAQKIVLGLLLLLALVSLVQWCWYLKRRSDFGKLPRWVQRVLVWVAPASWLVLWLTHVLLSLRDGQYFVHGLVTYAEAFSSEQGVVLISAVTVVMWLLFAVILAGFIFLARRAARYGVVPVRKIRRTA
jgi:cytochrome d ubiquinol oxidase subunit I